MVLLVVVGRRMETAGGETGRGRNFPSLVLILFAVPVGLAVRVAVVHVLAVRSGVREPLQALAALEWFLAAVQALVLRQVVFVLEGLWTLDALVGALTCDKDREKMHMLEIIMVSIGYCFLLRYKYRIVLELVPDMARSPC